MNHQSLMESLYDAKYAKEAWAPLVLRPRALSTTRFDDVARLLDGTWGSALDVGCGSGRLTLALAERFGTTHGLDISSVRVERAREMMRVHYPQHIGRVHFKTGGFEAGLPYPDDSFDVVIACAVIEHVIDVFGAMRELRRVCKPNGLMVVCVPNICYIKHALNLLVGLVPLTGAATRDVERWQEEGWDGGHLHYFSKRSLRDLLRLYEFEPVRWTGDGKWARLRRWHVNLVGSLTVIARRTSG